MALVELTMPAMGEAVMEATILKWLKQVGDSVAEEEPVVEIATDKVDSEILANKSGVIKELFFKENEVAPIGAKIALIETAEEIIQPEKNIQEIISNNDTDKQNAELPYVSANLLDNEKNISSENNNGFYSPLILSIAKKENITYDELAAIPGTGNENRLTKKDLLSYLENKAASGVQKIEVDNLNTSDTEKNVSGENFATDEKKETLPDKKEISTGKPLHVAVQAPAEFTAAPAFPTFNGESEIIEMGRIRKLIAQNMKDSQNTSATVTSFAEVDVSNMVAWREKIKHDFEKCEQTKITFTPMFIECITRVVKRFPLINSSVENDKIIIKKNINIGIATVLPDGNLIVPVIKDADFLNLVGLAKNVNSIASKARNNQLNPGDTQDGTFTVTNVGSYGSITGTPIIHQPQVAILAIGTIKKRPVVISSQSGDAIVIRSMAILALSYDHRIIDGALGSVFLRDVVNEIEAWDIKRAI